ncbi:hypothetical protein BHM03_00009361 [Ensete ventricosum]|nr:hypothetical protein BHM03_00009361 [Ensete ventricosum]
MGPVNQTGCDGPYLLKRVPPVQHRGHQRQLASCSPTGSDYLGPRLIPNVPRIFLYECHVFNATCDSGHWSKPRFTQRTTFN